MGALSSLLAGFGQGAGEHIAQVTEQKRQEQVQNTRLGAQAKFDYLKNNDDLSPEDKTRLLRSGMKDLGVKDADIGALEDHLKSMGLHPMQQKSQGGGQAPAPQGVAGAVPQAGAPQPSGTSGVNGPVPQPPDAVGRISQVFDQTAPQPPGEGASVREIKAYNTALQQHLQAKNSTLQNTQVNSINAEEQTKRQQSLIDTRIAALKKSGDWESLSPRQRAEVQIGAVQITPEMRPQTAGIIDTPKGATEPDGTPITSAQVKAYRLPDGQMEFHPYTITSNTTLGTGAVIKTDRFGNQVGATPGAVAPSMMPHETSTTGVRQIQTQGPNGPETSLVPVTTGSRRTVQGVAGPVPQAGGTVPAAQPSTKPVPGAPRSFPKPLTPEETMKANISLGQQNIALERMQYVRDHLDLVNNLIDAKKLALVTDPNTGVIHSVIARGINLTDEEAKLAGSMRNLMEDINLLRGPMGATGFRGPEAFAALQAQAGTLMGNPKVTKEVLDGSFRALSSVRDQTKRALGQGGLTPPPINPDSGPKEITTKKDFDALPSGTIYLENGKKFRKP